MIRFLTILLLAATLALPAFAQTEDRDERLDPNYNNTIRDSIYFTLDDGVMSPEEMAEEAEYVHQECTISLTKRTFFNCDCIAGEFLLRRERLGPTVPQSDILTNMMESAKGVCPNTERFAAESYSDCMEVRAIHAELATPEENDRLCHCAANKAALDFAKKPLLDVTYSITLVTGAMAYCSDPNLRLRTRQADINRGSLVPPKTNP